MSRICLKKKRIFHFKSRRKIINFNVNFISKSFAGGCDAGSATIKTTGTNAALSINPTPRMFILMYILTFWHFMHKSKSFFLGKAWKTAKTEETKPDWLFRFFLIECVSMLKVEILFPQCSRHFRSDEKAIWIRINMEMMWNVETKHL